MEGSGGAFVVKVFNDDGALLFEGAVSQKGDFIHFESYPTKRILTLRVHDKTPTLEELQLELSDQLNQMENT